MAQESGSYYSRAGGRDFPTSPREWFVRVVLPYKWWSAAVLTGSLIAAGYVTQTHRTAQVDALAQRNADMLLYLSVETQAEAGPSVDSACRDHVMMLRYCSQYMQNSTFYAPFHRDLKGDDPGEQLASIVKSLEENIGGSATVEKVHAAGLSLEQFYLSAYEVLQTPKSFETVLRGPSEEAMHAVTKQLMAFEEALTPLEKTASFGSAETACRESRKAGLYLFASWPEYMRYGDADRIEQFMATLKRAVKLVAEVKAENLVQRIALCEYTHSLHRRLDVFTLMRGQDGMQAARTHLANLLENKALLKGDCGG